MTNCCRWILALTLIFSGYVKAIDPLGTQYKLTEYLTAAGIITLIPDNVVLMGGIMLSCLEFYIGMSLVFAIRRKLMARLALMLMSIMTVVTIWIAAFNPVQDCGCFGDVIHLTNGETLLKNIVLTLMALMLAKYPREIFRFISKSNHWIINKYTILFILISSTLSLYTLPFFDFRPYRIGTNIKKDMSIPEGAEKPEFKTTFTLRKGNVTKEFDLEHYPDSTWTFVSSNTIQTKTGYIPPIHDFSITTARDGIDITDEVLSDTGYTFLLIAPILEKADDSNFDRLGQIYDYARKQKIKMYCLTASDENGIKKWIALTGAEYPFAHTDQITLKTIIRSNPGLLLIKNGTIINKWSHNALPQTPEDDRPIYATSLGRMPQDSTSKKMTTIILWFILPLVLLTIADRIWMWSKWFRSKKNLKQTPTYKKTNNMRKKIVAGNWKMNLNLQEGVKLAEQLNVQLTQDKPNCDVVICTPFIHLATIAEKIDNNVLGLGAENCADKEQGAYTGEVSAAMVKSTGAQYVIIGHSERREYYHETNEILKEKVLLALKNGLKVIFCIGETLQQREENKQNEVVKTQLQESVYNLNKEDFKNIIIAYEPIWAIGTGKTATAEQAEEIHAYIRQTIAEQYDAQTADDTSILYGGSCKASNAPELFAKPDIDGGLIGGASLKAEDFKGIIDAWKQ